MTASARACPACHTPLPEEAQFCLRCGTATPSEPGAPSRMMATAAVEVAKVRSALAAHYRIERVLGEGGMATVYLAEDVKHHRKVAVKVMRPELAATLGAERFLREVEIAAKLSHPHILPMHDSGEIGGFLYYAMPYVEGESLRERLHRDHQLPVDEALQLARETAEALGYAHRRGIVHRDIKPANVLLGEGHALVADFGIARATDGGRALTQTGLAVGTPQYMSPEQASGEPDVDARADVYAIGAVLYEMLAGQAPYTGPTPQAVLAKSLTEEVVPLAQVRAGVPAAVVAVVAKAMARRPEDRYASGAELAQVLGAARDTIRSGAIAALPAGPSTVRVWGLFALGAVASLAVVYGLISRWGLAGWTFGLAVGLLAIGAAVVVATGRFEARRRASRSESGLARWFTWGNAARGGGLAGVLWVTTVLLVVFFGPGATRATDGGVRLAVLPFENQGDSTNAYFADGITDEVRGKLAALPGVLVTARSSSQQYRQTAKSPQQIAKELGVRYLLTATVRWQRGDGSAKRVQVSPELIDATNDAVKWQQSFDAALTDVFQVQGQIAGQVASALDLALGTRDRQELEERPTANLAAYDAFLRGEAISGNMAVTDPVPLRQAIREYDAAVALDSGFALAWAQLSVAHARVYGNSAPTPADAEAARQAAERALALAPGRPEGHRAMGGYYANIEHDFQRALDEYERGRQLAPTNADLLRAIGGTKQTLGRWQESVADLTQASTLDPRNVSVLRNLGSTLAALRRFPEARRVLDQALALAPTNLSLIENRAMLELGQGDLAGARAVVTTALKEADRASLLAYFATYQDLYWVLDEAQQQELLGLPLSYFDNNRGVWAQDLAQVYGLRGDRTKMRAYADSARLAWEEQLRGAPDDPQLPVLRALALAYMGRYDEAIREGERAVAQWPITRDASSGPYFQLQLVRIYLLAGEPEKALDQLEPLLKVPTYLSPGWLKVDPTFAPLRGNPRFQRLIAGA
jgi:TolB-like protein/tRNA A-37 threonylcarbamoyl transferase component Bud32